MDIRQGLAEWIYGRGLKERNGFKWLGFFLSDKM
jgi:hypothetical protein